MKFKDISDEKLEHFYKRTHEHIERVQNNARILENKLHEYFKGLSEITKLHDASKFESPEFKPYILLSWNYKMKREGKKFKISPEDQKKIYDVTFHHVKNNPHHPEYWTDQKDVINKNNRDENPDQIIDARKMKTIYLGEMICDWTALAQEFKEGNASKWANKVMGKRYKFSKEQEEIIWKGINIF